MQTFWAVTQDLYQFVFYDWFGYRSHFQSRLLLPSAEAPKQLTIDTADDNSVVYIAADKTALQAFPTQTFDGVIEMLPFGTALKATVPRGRWLEVLYNDIKGWVLKDDVVFNNADVFPQLHEGVAYQAHDMETVRIRQYLFDMFAGGAERLPLQETEYCAYRLALKGKFIAWPYERPRIPGRWQHILKGVIGVHISIEPHVDSVMEQLLDDGSGRLSYVESVLPDQSITVHEIGLHEPGEYTVRTIPQSVWREYRPVFLQIN